MMLLGIVFSAVFLTILGGLSSFILTENRLQDLKRAQSEALAVAEGGLEYYRWYLAHNPGDLTHGTGEAGPYDIEIPDPEGGIAGTASLSIGGNVSCGITTSIDIASTGTSARDASASRTVVGRYALPTVAQFSYVLNSSVWAGGDRIINGPYHSNGGVRMDGTANAPVTSSQATWNCTTGFGCNPGQPTAPGVVGNGPNQDLWNYPVPQVNFEAIAADFSDLQTLAETEGIFLGRYSSGNGGVAYHKGYHLIFNGDGTVTVQRVTNEYVMQSVPISNPSAGLVDDYTRIRNESAYDTYQIPADCPLIFVEDHTWIEGSVNGKVVVVAADVDHTGVAPYVIVPNNITYTAYDGSAGLTVIAEDDVLIGPTSPQDMTLNGIFIAQGGAFGRNLYTCSYPSYDDKGTLTILGTTVSNLRTGTKWTYSGYGCGSNRTSGYQTRIDAFDRRLVSDPPPFTPAVSPGYEFVEWREE